MRFFGGNEWKTFRQIETHLVTKNTAGACSGAVTFINTGFYNVIKQL